MLIFLKLYRCFCHCLQMCMWSGYNPQIIIFFFFTFSAFWTESFFFSLTFPHFYLVIFQAPILSNCIQKRYLWRIFKKWEAYILFVCLRFYGPVNSMGSCRARSVHLTALLLDSIVFSAVNQYCALSFTRNWQLPFFNQLKGDNDRRKYFMINLHKRMLPTWSNQNPDH